MAERLRRLTRNQIPSGSVGSNPTDCGFLGFGFLITKLYDLLILKWCVNPIICCKLHLRHSPHRCEPNRHDSSLPSYDRRPACNNRPAVPSCN